ncbi:ATP-binding protein [Nonomuraea pusilla]|uniref:Histidine kinase-like ATPase domain-containing protein n=1 Tax=Nonomuraea pusilla TaxID=46177 RepID=A0A1H7P958_9ACTN|nr:ATP-binding protein [Nonomuraea pusilla]SEL32169.1 Histidine kinase-like ATPase domain-containing protein [Nonomuraea pusilla]
MNDDVQPQEGRSAPRGRTGPPPGTPVTELRFHLPDLPRVREVAEGEARGFGMSADVVSDLVIAVNEVATNAVTHGGDHARLRMWRNGGDLYVEVRDEGAWKPGPQPGSVGGMGLWVCRLLAADLTVHAGEDGSTVTMRFPGKP